MNTRLTRNITTTLLGFAVAFGLGTSTVGCGGTDGGNGGGGTSAPSYKDQNLQGSAGGEDWSFTHGTIENFGGNKRIELYAAGEKPEDPCTFDTASYDGWTVNFSASLEEKRFELNNNRFVTFSKAPENVATKTGWFEFTSVGESQIEGELVAKSDGDHVVNGNFTAKRCTDGS